MLLSVLVGSDTMSCTLNDTTQVKKDRQADVDSGGHFTKAFIAEFDNQCTKSSRKRQREPEDDDDISCAEDDF
jgi:hypothetical protein